MELLLRWLNEELRLSAPVTSIEEDSRNGYLFGEIFAKYNQQRDFDQFVDKHTSAAKLRNLTLLEPTFRRLNVRFDAKTAFDVTEGVPKVALSLLSQIRIALASYFPGKRPEEYTTIIRVSRPQFDATMQKTFEDSLRMLLESDKEIHLREAVKRFTWRGEDLQMRATLSSQHSLRSAVQAVEYDIYRRRHEQSLQDEAKAEWEANQYMQWKTNQMRARKRRQMQATFAETQHYKLQTRREDQRLRDAELVGRSLDDFEQKLARTIFKTTDHSDDASSTSPDQDGTATWDDATMKATYRRDVKVMRQRKTERGLREVAQERRRKRYLKTDEQYWADTLQHKLVKELLSAADQLSKAERDEHERLSKLQQYARVFEANRLHREELYKMQNDHDVKHNTEFAEFVLQQDIAASLECAKMLGARQLLAEQAAASSVAERKRLLCLDSLYDMIELSLCAADARRFVGCRDSGNSDTEQIIPGFPSLWADMKAAFVGAIPIDQISAWLFSPSTEDTTQAIEEYLKLRDGASALCGLAPDEASSSGAQYITGEALIELRCIARPLSPAPSPAERLPTFKHRLAICASPGHDTASVAKIIAERLNLFVISVSDLIAECANMVIGDHAHLLPFPAPQSPVFDFLSSTDARVADALRDLSQFAISDSAESLNSACTTLQEQCDNVTSASTAISLDMKVAGATVVQCLQEGEDVNDELVVKLAVLGIRVAGLRLQCHLLEVQQCELHELAFEEALARWQRATSEKQQEIVETRARLEADPDLDDPDIAEAIERLEAQMPLKPEQPLLQKPDAPITGWVISDFPGTLSQANLFVERVSGYCEDKPPSWRGDRSSVVFPAAPMSRPKHACDDPGVDVFIKLKEPTQDQFLRIANTRSMQGEGNKTTQCSLLDGTSHQQLADQLVSGGLACVAPTNSTLHMLPIQQHTLSQGTELVSFLERLQRLLVVEYSSSMADEIVLMVARPEPAEPILDSQHKSENVGLTADTTKILDAPEPGNDEMPVSADPELSSTAEQPETQQPPSDDDATADKGQSDLQTISQQDQPELNLVAWHGSVNITSKAAAAVVERVKMLETAYIEMTRTHADMLRQVTTSLYQREHSMKRVLRQFMGRAANFQAIWDELCNNINTVDDSFRFDEQVMQEFALRCELSRKSLWEHAEQRLEENRALLKNLSEDGWKESVVGQLDNATACLIQAEVSRFEACCGLITDMYRLCRPHKTRELQEQTNEKEQEYAIKQARHWEQSLAAQQDPPATSRKGGKGGAAQAAVESEPLLPRVETLTNIFTAESTASTDKAKKKGKDSKAGATTKKGALAEIEPPSPFRQAVAGMEVAMTLISPWLETEYPIPEAETTNQNLEAVHRAIWHEAKICKERIEAHAQTANAAHDHLCSRIGGCQLQLRKEIWARHLEEASVIEACLKFAEICVLEHRPLPFDMEVEAVRAAILESRLLQPPPKDPVVAYDGKLEEHVASLPSKTVNDVVQTTPSWSYIAHSDVREIADLLLRLHEQKKALEHLQIPEWEALVKQAIQEQKQLEIIP